MAKLTTEKLNRSDMVSLLEKKCFSKTTTVFKDVVQLVSSEKDSCLTKNGFTDWVFSAGNKITCHIPYPVINTVPETLATGSMLNAAMRMESVYLNQLRDTLTVLPDGCLDAAVDLVLIEEFISRYGIIKSKLDMGMIVPDGAKLSYREVFNTSPIGSLFSSDWAHYMKIGSLKDYNDVLKKLTVTCNTGKVIELYSEWYEFLKLGFLLIEYANTPLSVLGDFVFDNTDSDVDYLTVLKRDYENTFKESLERFFEENAIGGVMEIILREILPKIGEVELTEMIVENLSSADNDIVQDTLRLLHIAEKYLDYSSKTCAQTYETRPYQLFSALMTMGTGGLSRETSIEQISKILAALPPAAMKLFVWCTLALWSDKRPGLRAPFCYTEIARFDTVFDTNGLIERLKRLITEEIDKVNFVISTVASNLLTYAERKELFEMIELVETTGRCLWEPVLLCYKQGLTVDGDFPSSTDKNEAIGLGLLTRVVSSRLTLSDPKHKLGHLLADVKPANEDIGCTQKGAIFLRVRDALIEYMADHSEPCSASESPFDGVTKNDK